jgi:hypothetical protein
MDDIQTGFYQHTLYFQTLEQAQIAETMILPKFKALMNCLGQEVNEDDGPCLQFQTKEPLDEHLRLLINREWEYVTEGVIASYNVPFATSYEQYQLWRKMPDQDEQGPSEEERIEARRVHWEERKAIEADYIQRYW